MTTLAAVAADRTFWTVALVIGAVVLAILVALMALLLSFLKDTAASVTRLLEVGEELEASTAAVPELADAGPVLEMVEAETLVHDRFLESRLR